MLVRTKTTLDVRQNSYFSQRGDFFRKHVKSLTSRINLEVNYLLNSTGDKLARVTTCDSAKFTQKL